LERLETDRAMRPRVPPRPWAATALACALLAAGCRHVDDFVWVHDLARSELAPPAQEPGYRIAPGDVIGIRVWGQDMLTIPQARVRDDGKISVPFLQDVEVAGVTPDTLSRQLQTKLKAYIVNPTVTVTLESPSPVRVSILGEVARPGTYDLERGAGVLRALAAAGGLTEYAERDGIFVVRAARPPPDASRPPPRVRFRFEDLTRPGAAAAAYVLVAGDAVVVE
jgi:polysaccharide export outer membrane protein